MKDPMKSSTKDNWLVALVVTIILGVLTGWVLIIHSAIHYIMKYW